MSYFLVLNNISVVFREIAHRCWQILFLYVACFSSRRDTSKTFFLHACVLPCMNYFAYASTELQRGPGGGRARGGVQLYDTPYEDERGQRLGLSYGEPQEEGKESSRLPQDDERPADEYDQPWEWKKDHISKAFAGNWKNDERFLRAKSTKKAGCRIYD